MLREAAEEISQNLKNIEQLQDVLPASSSTALPVPVLLLLLPTVPVLVTTRGP